MIILYSCKTTELLLVMGVFLHRCIGSVGEKSAFTQVLYCNKKYNKNIIQIIMYWWIDPQGEIYKLPSNKVIKMLTHECTNINNNIHYSEIGYVHIYLYFKYFETKNFVLLLEIKNFNACFYCGKKYCGFGNIFLFFKEDLYTSSSTSGSPIAHLRSQITNVTQLLCSISNAPFSKWRAVWTNCSPAAFEH